MAVRQSAGILLFRRSRTSDADDVEVLLAHPGGPFFTNKDEGCWSIPKGEPDAGEDDLLAVARREFAEEVGSEPPDSRPDGVAAGGARDDRPEGRQGRPCVGRRRRPRPGRRPSRTRSSWSGRPGAGSGRRSPRSTASRWFGPDDARRRLKATQTPFVDRLVALLAGDPSPDDGAITTAKPDGA